MAGMVGNGFANVYRDSLGNWRQGQPDDEQQLVRDAMHETEDEILDSAFDREPDENDYDNELEQIEGIDGEALSDFEIAHRNIYGDGENGYDRQVALHADQELLRQNQELQAANERVMEQYRQEFNAPERVAARRAQQNEQFYQQTGMLPTDEGKANQFYAQMDAAMAHQQQLQHSHINSSMTLAHERYGDHFQTAFDNLRDSGDRNMIARVMNSPDPGSAVMQYGYGTTNANVLPSLNSGENYGGRSAPSRGRQQDISEGPRWENDETEIEIARSVWDD